ncbi:MAG TPA: rhodanese-like domain-containing protein [Arenimonas sp.]|nr:rhodanese-like domain-containing protein [Arenimonas sp.]
MNRHATLSLTMLFSALVLTVPAGAQDSFGSAPTPPPAQPPPQTQPPPPRPAPQGVGTPAPAPPGYGQPAPPTGQETQDVGVAPTAQLKSGSLHGPTPSAIPGGRLVTTPELAQLMRDASAQALVFDVLGGPQRLPNAIPVVPASQAGNFQDSVQHEFGQYLQQATQGRKDRPMVFYCQGTQCWMSYNAALRAIALGYTKVLWYRGGIEAWQQAGLPLQPWGQGNP